jgi:CubicO group peptidase (beta-lactamase class C family)
MNIIHPRNPFSSSRPASQNGFDLHADRCLNDLKHLILSSNTPQTSIHVEVEGKIQRRTIFGQHPRRSSLASGAPDRSESTAFSATPTPPDPSADNTSHTSSETNIHEVGANTIYAIASCTKILINVAYHKLISQGRFKSQGLSWEKSACDLLDELRRARGKTGVRRFSRDPMIIELLLHRNGFAPMNRYLFAPDETFIMSQDEFLEIAPRITEDYFKGGKQGWTVYSNANHIFAGIILEELAEQKLHEIMQEVIFIPFKMTHTAMDKVSLDTLEAAGAIIADGHRVSGDMSQSTDLQKQKYLTDTVEVAALGARSSTDDLAKLIREFMKALDNSSSHFQEREALDFFGPKGDFHDGGKVALGGLFCALDSILPGSESLNRILVPSSAEFSPYRLGRRPSGSHCRVYYKAGSVDGFTSSIYVSLKHRLFVIVLANSTGPVDVTDHIARYILQETLNLWPRVDILSRASEEGLRAKRRAQEFERADTDLSGWSEITEGMVGTYRHVKYGQELEITTEGDAILRGRSKPSSAMKARVSGNTARIFPGSEGFGIERWSVWGNCDFTRNERDGELFLVGNTGQDHYKRTSVP